MKDIIEDAIEQVMSAFHEKQRRTESSMVIEEEFLVDDAIIDALIGETTEEHSTCIQQDG